ncbi:hypothetical protein [Natronomonas marina]|jgi:hypothetical protein|uniref:hypothetical protein n=1 Tax=Natronomonas marina TaxID=2961939 RepID=UPI0020C9DE16|nr:hypothetical protein [Natronomonas marina]
MRRRRYLAGLAGTASLLAGCSTGDDAEEADETVTPAPVPGEAPATLTDSSGVVPETVGDAHVGELSGGSATVGVEYAALADGEPFESTRVLSTVDGAAFTYRRFDVRRTAPDGVSRTFRGIWYEDGEAVFRFVKAQRKSVYREPDDFDPPSPGERFDRDRIVSTLAAFDPTTTAATDGYRLAAGEVTHPDRLPTGDRIDGDTVGSLSARLESAGTVPELRAWFSGAADGDPVVVTYRLAVTDRGETTVERPDSSDTFDWFLELKDGSPIERVTSTPVGAGDPLGRRRASNGTRRK